MTAPERPRRERWIRAGFVALIVAGVLLTAFFGLRAVRSYLRLRNAGLQPGVADVEAIRGWMTIPYIAEAYGVPQDILFAALDVPPAGNEARSLSDLNRQLAPDQRGYVLQQIKDALRRYQTEHPATPAETSP